MGGSKGDEAAISHPWLGDHFEKGGDVCLKTIFNVA